MVLELLLLTQVSSNTGTSTVLILFRTNPSTQTIFYNIPRHGKFSEILIKHSFPLNVVLNINFSFVTLASEKFCIDNDIECLLSVFRVLEIQGSNFDSKTDGETNKQSHLVERSLLQLQTF
jgi:hypothetical protein